MIQSSRLFLFVVSFSLIFQACKEEQPVVKTNEPSESEREFFEDYQSSIFKWGYIDRTGEQVIENLYDETRDFNEGLAAVSFEGRWGYIDIMGANIIPHEYKEAYNFSNGVALVRSFENEWKVIDKKGNIKFTNDSQSLSSPTHNLLISSNGFLKGVIDTEGKQVLATEYERIKISNNNVLVARKDGFYGLWNHNGENILPPSYKKITVDGYPMLLLKNDEGYFYMDVKDKKLLGADMEKALPFYVDKTIIKSGNYKLVDQNMKTIKEFDYNQIRYGGEEKWFFEKDNLWGIMDKNGEVIKEPEYKLLNKYFEGRVAYGESDDRWGYLDENGNVIVSARYALVWDYKNGLARHIGNPGIGFIDKEGKTVIEGKFYEVRDFNEGLARVQVYF